MSLFRRRRAEPPRDVRIIRADGTTVPLELVYVGRRGGTHVWRAVLEPVRWRPGDELHVGTLPARTTIEVLLDPVAPG